MSTAPQQKAPASARIDARPVSYAVGVEIHGVDISAPQDDATVQAIRDLWVKHGVVILRDQNITPHQHLAFSERFGELQMMALSRYNHPDVPQIFLVSTRPVDGKPSETRNTGRQWHSDHSFAAEPAMGSLLYCIEAPAAGGSTLFANQYMAYEALSEPLKKMLDGRKAWHDLYRLKDFQNRAAFSEEDRQRTPPRAHPIFRTHPETGRKALFVNEAWTFKIDGMAEDESKPILDYLFHHSTQPVFTYRHYWRPGDLLFWDNRVVMHYAPPDYDMSDPKNIRHMHRTTLKGDAPF